MKPHPHKALILQWVDGAEIEVQVPASGKWIPACAPRWDEQMEYRIKPAAPVIETKMTADELRATYNGTNSYIENARVAANAGIARALADDQVVTKEEYEKMMRASEERIVSSMKLNYSDIEQRASRDMAVARAVEGALNQTRSKADLAAIIAKVK